MFLRDNNRPAKYIKLNVISDCLIRALVYATHMSYDEIAKKFGVYNLLQKGGDLAKLDTTLKMTMGNAKKLFKDNIQTYYTAIQLNLKNMSVRRFAQLYHSKKFNFIIQCNSPDNKQSHAVFMSGDGIYIDKEDCGNYIVKQFILTK